MRNTSGTLRSLSLITIGLLCFLGLSAQPVITAVSPVSGRPTATVNITGTGFGTGFFGNIVYFGGQRCNVLSSAPTIIQAQVPFGTTYGYISVTTNGLTAYSPLPFIPTFGIADVQITTNTFRERVDSPTGLNPIGVVIVDLDGDGRDDIATANNANSPVSTISVLLNTGHLNGPGNPTTVSFAPKVELDEPVGSIPNAIAFGDIDGDGKMDLIATSLTTNSTPSMVSVFKNASSVGQVSFPSRTDLTPTSGPYGVAVGDLDGDGKPDIVVTNFLSNSISIFRNTSASGNISFAPKVDVATALAPHSVVIADIDGDGKVDIAVTNTFSGSFSVFRNQSTNGSLAFATRADIASGSDLPFSLVAGDLDGDGKQDIVVTNYNFNSTTAASTSFSVFHNNSTAGIIAFNVRSDYSGGDAFFVTLGDINGDGRPDIILPNMNGIDIYQNTGSLGQISLGAPVNFPFFSPFQAQAGDFDSDGKPDLAVANFSSAVITVLKNKTSVPVISEVLPDSAGVGLTVKLAGSNFDGVSAVSFGGVAAASFTLIAPDTIAAVIGSGATGDISVTTPNGTGVLANGFVFVATPVVGSFTPSSATTGDLVTISGSNFTGASSVSFGGMPAASFTVLSPTSIQAVVGTGSTGNVTVATRGGTANLAGFVFTGPGIASFTPDTGYAGAVVSITGTNFTGATEVRFGGIPAASFTVNSATSITAVVGPGASGDVLVRSPGGTGTRGGFTHRGPSINGFSPAIAGPGTPVTITGLHFTGATAVSFGGTAATSFAVTSDTSITALVASGSSGGLMVTTPFGSAVQPGFTFTTQPIITTLIPAAGPVGSAVSIKGSNFSPVATNNIVYFGSVRATVTNASVNTLLVTVPPGADYRPVSVTVGGLTVYSPAPFDVTFPNGVLAPASFVNRVDFPLSGATYGFAVSDLDGDGWSDLGVSEYNGHALSLFKNTTAGTLSFAPRTDIPMAGYVSNVLAGDWDGDGIPDLATLSNGLNVFHNTGAMNLTSVGAFSTPNAVPDDFAVGDFDGDGKPDIVVSGAGETGGSAYLSFFQNTSAAGVIGFAPRWDIWRPGGGSLASQHIAVGDMDGDGRPDLAVITNETQTIDLYRNTSTGGVLSFADPVEYMASGPVTYAVMGDIDGDGKPDLAISSYDDFYVYVFRNTSGSGALSLGPEIRLRSGYGTRGITLGDLDGDGRPDIAVAGSYSNNLTIIRNNSVPGGIAFGAEYGYQTGTFPQAVAITDLDHDSKPEIVVTNYGGSVSVFKNSIGLLKLDSFSPRGAGVYDTVTINGRNFTGTTAVSFGGYPPLSVSVVSDSVIKAVVGDGGSGNVSVQTPEGAVSMGGFIFLPVPYINFAGPNEFCAGDSVKLVAALTYAFSFQLADSIQWYRNGAAIAGATDSTLEARDSGDYSVTAMIGGYARRSFAVTVSVKPAPPKPVITPDAANALRSSAAAGNQWYVGTTLLISGADSVTYHPDSSGAYAVRVTVDGCSSAFSDVFLYVKPASTSNPSKVQIGPNPATDHITVTFDPPQGETVTAKITDFSGNVLLQLDNVHTGQSIFVGNLPKGVYALKVVSSGGTINEAILFTKL